MVDIHTLFFAFYRYNTSSKAFSKTDSTLPRCPPGSSRRFWEVPQKQYKTTHIFSGRRLPRCSWKSIQSPLRYSPNQFKTAAFRNPFKTNDMCLTCC